LVAPIALAATSCFVFLPESSDRVALATDQARDTCGGTVVEPRMVGPSDVERVEALYSTVPSRSGHDVHLLGARLFVRPSSGMTAELLARVLRCHEARQVLGTEPPAPASPYVVPNGWVKIKVESDDGFFVVRLFSLDHATAKEILARARAFHAGDWTPGEQPK
jgi:hypothetical protein